jgi:hypothetical protein
VDSMMQRNINKLAELLILKDIKIPVILDGPSNPILFTLLNQALSNRKDLLLPNFEKAKTVCIFSDYGGETPNSKYFTYTITLADYDFLRLNFETEIKSIRNKYGLNDPYKEISFKDLKYGPINRSLDEYLTMVNNSVHGLVFTLIVDKSIISILGENNKSTHASLTETLQNSGLGKWKGKTAEKLQRVISIISYFVNLLVPSGKQLFWMTDEDSIVANPRMREYTGTMFNYAVHQFKDRKYSLVGYATPFEKGKDSLFIDLLSISDLVAGSIEHYFTRKSILDELTVSEGADKVLKWLSIQGIGLKKLSFKVNYSEESFTGGIVDFHLIEPYPNAQLIEINLK